MRNTIKPFNPVMHARTPLHVDIAFVIKADGAVFWDGHAGPYVDSGSQFGGAFPLRDGETSEGMIKDICKRQCDWFKWYGRKIVLKTTISDQRTTQSTLF